MEYNENVVVDTSEVNVESKEIYVSLDTDVAKFKELIKLKYPELSNYEIIRHTKRGLNNGI